MHKLFIALVTGIKKKARLQPSYQFYNKVFDQRQKNKALHLIVDIPMYDNLPMIEFDVAHSSTFPAALCVYYKGSIRLSNMLILLIRCGQKKQPSCESCKLQELR